MFLENIERRQLMNFLCCRNCSSGRHIHGLFVVQNNYRLTHANTQAHIHIHSKIATYLHIYKYTNIHAYSLHILKHTEDTQTAAQVYGPQNTEKSHKFITRIYTYQTEHGGR